MNRSLTGFLDESWNLPGRVNSPQSRDSVDLRCRTSQAMTLLNWADFYRQKAGDPGHRTHPGGMKARNPLGT